MGFGILYYPKKDNLFRLASKIHLIGWFGVLHGINEWLDLMVLISAPFGKVPESDKKSQMSFIDNFAYLYILKKCET